MSRPRVRGHRHAGPLVAHAACRHFGIVEASTAAIIASVAAAALSAAGGVTAAVLTRRQATETADYNVDVSEQQAELARRAGEAAEADTREETTRLKALQRAQLSDTAITGEGTPLLLLLDSAAQAEEEALRARYTGQVNQQSSLAAAQQFRLQKSQAAQRASFGVGTSLLTGAANVGTALYPYPKVKA